MAEYTVELRTIIESGINIFDFPYEFYDEMKRRDFEQNFIRHFFFREIGQETVDRFKWYLEDKMHTVFPFYNELMKTALIEYDKVYNYDMTEKYERTGESSGDTRATNNSVGRFNQEQNNKLETTQDVTTEGGVTSKDVTVTESEGQSVTDTVNDGTSETNNNVRVNGSVTENNNADDVHRHSDTPAGRLDLSEADYLSSLDHDIHTDAKTTINSETTAGKTDTITHDEGNSETNETGKSTTTRDGQVDTTEEQSTITKTDGLTTDEQISRNDSEARQLSENKNKEEYTLTRKGNIGIQTASDMLEKHIELQRKLKRIEESFFAECNDLFMLIY